jgi:hypothetical protein
MTASDNAWPGVVQPEPDSRLAQLCARYDAAKIAADDAAGYLKSITDGIKVELAEAAPGETRVDLVHPALTAPLRLQAKTTWRLDTPRFRAEQPETYVRYAKQSVSWELRAVSG